MRSYQPERLLQLEDPALLQRLQPFLQEAFDPISLDRPGFLAEIGLEPGDDSWLRAGARYRPWALSAVFGRAFAEEARAVPGGGHPAGLLERCRTLRGEALWRQCERLLRRLDQIVGGAWAETLGLSAASLEDYRRRWLQEDQQQVLDGLALHLRGCGPAAAVFLEQPERQSWRRFLWFFRRPRPVLSRVNDADIEPNVWLTSPLAPALHHSSSQGGCASPEAPRSSSSQGGCASPETPRSSSSQGGCASPETPRYLVSEAFARELLENAELSPELWAKQWVDFLSRRSELKKDEFQALLDHFEEKERFRWPNLVAVGGARARRAVAAVALLALQKWTDPGDVQALERLWQMIPDFAERYELQQVLKRPEHRAG